MAMALVRDAMKNFQEVSSRITESLTAKQLAETVVSIKKIISSDFFSTEGKVPGTFWRGGY